MEGLFQGEVFEKVMTQVKGLYVLTHCHWVHAQRMLNLQQAIEEAVQNERKVFGGLPLDSGYIKEPHQRFIGMMYFKMYLEAIFRDNARDHPVYRQISKVQAELGLSQIPEIARALRKLSIANISPGKIDTIVSSLEQSLGIL